MIAFGPVPSRRLGRSLGINNIPPKICTYSCVYCQLGRTLKMQIERQAFYPPQEIVDAVRDKVDAVRARGETIDYLTFVPDGEPTLDLNLGVEIAALSELDIAIAVISNASLIGREDVRADLMGSDWVSLKVDAVTASTWRRVDRPYGSFELEEILEGARVFAGAFEGELATETMLVDGVNDSEADLRAVAAYLGELQPDVAYIAVPTRPPAEGWAAPADEAAINMAFQLLRDEVDSVELLLGYEGTAFSSSGDVEQDLLSITAVHPMREDAVQELLDRAGSNWQIVERLLEQGELVVVGHDGERFYLRRIGTERFG